MHHPLPRHAEELAIDETNDPKASNRFVIRNVLLDEETPYLAAVLVFAEILDSCQKLNSYRERLIARTDFDLDMVYDLIASKLRGLDLHLDG